jgi:hypothetical protein
VDGSSGRYAQVTCNNITVVGKGKTTILGGFIVDDQKHVTFEGLTLTNDGGYGLEVRGTKAKVDVLKCIVKECGDDGMNVSEGATVTATQCEFMGNFMGKYDADTGGEDGANGVCCEDDYMDTKVRLNECTMHHNEGYGLWAWGAVVVDLHGTKTEIHSNEGGGIRAGNHAEVNIHLPSQHNTSHDNDGDDLDLEGIKFGWTNPPGSIANINADGSFEYFEVEDGDDY